MVYQFVILTMHKNLIAGRLERFLKTKEPGLCGEIDGPCSALSPYHNLIGPVPDNLPRDVKRCRGAKCVVCADLLRGDWSAINQHIVCKLSLDLAACAKIIVQREHHDGSVSRVAPLTTAAILDQPVSDGFDKLVLRIDSQECAQGKRRCLDASFRPTPVNTVFAPVRGSNNRRVGGLRSALHD